MNNAKNKSSIIQKIDLQKIVIISVLVILFIFFSAMAPTFRKYTTIITLFGYMYYILLMAIGVTFPLITGGVDLSIGTGLVCYSIVGSYLINHQGMPIWVGILVTLLLGTAMGAFNGLVVSVLELPPFITTLCTMMIARGLGSILAGGLTGVWPVAGSQNGWVRSVFRLTLKNGTIIPIGMLWMLIIIAIMTIVLTKTRVGRYTIAIGSNKEALRLSGVRVIKWHVIAYMISGFFAGLAALAYGWTFTTITPGTGAGFELDAIGAAIIGGTSMTGGKGSIIGTFLGVLLISLLKTGLPYVGLQANWQQIITGIVLLVAVTVDMIRSKKR